MKTYEQLKDNFYREVQITGRTKKSSDRLMTQAWIGHMAQVVCGTTRGAFSNGKITGAPKTFQFPTPTSEPLTFSETHTAHPSAGGGAVVRKAGGFRATKATEDEKFSWVATIIDGEMIAMSIPEAFKRGLNEVEMPKRPVGRPSQVGGRKVNTYLDAESIATASMIGNGNVSEGIRKALLNAAIQLNKG